MSNTLKLGNGKWATGKDTVLGYNSENNNIKPLPFSFSRASSGTVINKDGLIETVGSGEPRIDFKDNTKGSLLLEPQRSNLITYSEDFENSDWTKNGGTTITNNYAISPDGSLNASRYLGTGTSGLGDKFTLSVTDYTISFYVKSNTSENQYCRLIGDSSNVSENLLITTEWTRLSYTFTGSGLSNKSNGIFRDSSNNDIDILIYGAQLEQGSYATSYIPTSGSAVTRVADSTSQTPPSGIIGQTEGTVFLDTKMALQSINNYQLFSINNGGSSDRIRILTATGNRLRFIYQLDGGSTVYSFYNPTDYGSLTSLKIAFTYKSGDIKVYINGVLVDSSTNTFTIAEKLVNIDIATSAGGYNQMFFNDVKVYNTALTDQELQALTQ